MALLAESDEIAGETLAEAGCMPFVMAENGTAAPQGPSVPAVQRSGGRTTPAALVQFTSGSTGAPRPVRLTAANVEANVRGDHGLGRDR